MSLSLSPRALLPGYANSTLFFAMVRAPLKRASSDDIGTLRHIAEEVLSLAPVSGPVLVDSPPPVDPTFEVVPTGSGEVAPALLPFTVEPVVVSGEGSQGAQASNGPLSSSGDREVRGLPSGSSGSLRRGESPSSHV